MDVSVWELWLPILLSAVGVFILSFLAHMVIGHHRKDWTKLPNEDAVMETVRSGNIPGGQYMYPFCDMKDWKDPEKKKRWEAGPHGTMVVWPGAPSMAKNMVLTFIFYVVVGFCVAYVAALAFRGHPAVEYMQVFRVTGTVAILAYCLGSIPGTIWFGHSWRSQFLYIIDGIVYGLCTGGFFGWLWPMAEEAMPAMPALGG